MDFIDALRVLGRQWRVMLAGFLVVLVLCVAAIFAVPTKYQATGQLIMLLPPQATGTTSPTNPYLNLEPGLTVTASLIASSVSTKDSARSLKAAGFTSDYAIGLSPDAGPVLQISAEDTDGVMAVRTRNEVILRLQEELTKIQLAENSPPRQLIHASANGVPNVAEALPGSKIRALAVIAALGVILTLMVAFVRDRRAFSPAQPKLTESSRSRSEVLPGSEQPTPLSPLKVNGQRRRRREREAVSAAPHVGWWDT